ncbi:MAG TPA: MFS transporter [Terriglobales bacterium]|nr:MFS transporter [Terriglobales bacterium]
MGSPTQPDQNGSRIKLVFRALRHRNFQLFFSGQLISLVGTWMQNIAQAWLVYRITGSSLALGSIGFVSQIPVFIAAPIGGTIADRYNRHKLVIGTQISSMVLALILAALTLTGTIQLWHIFVLSALLGFVNGIDIPARQSFMVEMVGKEDLMNAIALNSSMFNGARIIGPAIAGVLVAAIGEGWCFFVNGVSYIAVIVGLLMMQVTPHRVIAQSSPVKHIIEGFQFVRGAIAIRDLLLLLGVVSLVAMPYAVLMPIFADRILHGGAKGLGILMGATGVGALLAALSLAARSGTRGLGRLIGYAAFGFGASLILFSLSRSFWLSVALLIPVGYGMMLETTTSNTLIQVMVPDELRGRVLAVYTMMFMGMAPLGSLFAGGVADKIGAPLTLAIGGIVCMAAAGVFLSRLPKFRISARQMVVAQGLAGGDPPQEITAAGIAHPPFSAESDD